MKSSIVENIYRSIFVVAGVYNLTFSFWFLSSPESLFALADSSIPVSSAFILPLAIAITAFGILYFLVAWRPYQSLCLVSIALLGKAGTPLLLLFLVLFCDWSPVLFKMVFFNDLIWCVPFFLLFRVNVRRRLSCYP